jgi:membrane protease YdiL (CAAX protease family)
MVSALPLVNLLTEINTNFQFPFEKLENYLRGLEGQTESLMMKLIIADSLPALFLNLFMIALIPAVGEELVFRGLIQRHLSDLFRNPHIGVLLASVIFSLAHFQFYSFLPRFFLGLLLGYMLEYGKSLWYPILAHLLNNAMGVLFYYFQAKQQAGESLEEIGTTEMMPIAALVSFLLVSGMMFAWVVMVKPIREE